MLDPLILTRMRIGPARDIAGGKDFRCAGLEAKLPIGSRCSSHCIKGLWRPVDRMCTHDRTLCVSGRATAAVATLRNSRREASGVMIVPTALKVLKSNCARQTSASI